MATAIQLPKIGAGLGLVPIIPRPGILPTRVTPRLIPRLFQYATRVRVHVHAYTLPNGRTVPEADLIPKFISNSVDDGGNFHEYYALMRGGDPECFMDLSIGPDIEEGNIFCEVCRCCGAAVDIYLDDTLMCTFPEITPEMTAPYIGETSFLIPIQEATA